LADSGASDGAAWHDDDDNKIDLTSKSKYKRLRETEDEVLISSTQFEQRLKSHYSKIFSSTSKWADGEGVNADGGLTSTDIFSKTPSWKPDAIKVCRVRDANWNEVCQSVVKSVKWHESGQVMLTAGLDKTLRLFHIDGKENAKLSSVHFKNMPIYCADFVPFKNEVIVSGRRRHFCSFDVESGKIDTIPYLRGRDERSLEHFKISPNGDTICFRALSGEMVLVSVKSKQAIGTLKMNGCVKDFAYSADGYSLLSTGSDSEIYQWDLRNMNCFARYADEGLFFVFINSRCS
jgi:U3 small nucleolar RNA-associated protein 18